MTAARLPWLYEVAIALDRLGHAVGGGDSRLTISGACWRAEEAGGKAAKFWRKTIDWGALHIFGQRNHCQRSDAYDCALVAWSVGRALADGIVG